MQRKPTDSGVLGVLLGSGSANVMAAAVALVLIAGAVVADVCGAAAAAAAVTAASLVALDDEDAPGAARLRTMPDRMLFCDGRVEILFTLGLAISA